MRSIAAPQMPLINIVRQQCQWALVLSVLGFALLLAGCERRGPSVTTIQNAGEIRVAIEFSPHTYISAGEVVGFHHDLAEAYAAALGVTLKPVYVDNRIDLIKAVRSRRVHLGVGMIPVTNDPGNVEFGPSLATTDLIVVTRTDAKAIQSRRDLSGRSIAVSFEEIAEDPFADDMLEFFDVTAIPNAATDDLLKLVDDGTFDAAIVSAIDFLALNRKYPQLHRRFTLRESVPIAWLLADSAAPSLRQSLKDFVNGVQADNRLAAKWRYYFQHLSGFDFVEARAFRRNVDDRLVTFQPHFEMAAERNGFDWRLLAALSYQESHWDPAARSPTGVRGIMMLTKQTAKELEVSRLDPKESIDGGARYLNTLMSRLPDRIDAQNRLLLALAAYNIGWGHLQDARRLTKRLDGDPDRWQDVREKLPLLALSKHAAGMRHGKARGSQAVHFVDRVRRYFDILRLLVETPATSKRSDPAASDQSSFWSL